MALPRPLPITLENSETETEFRKMLDGQPYHGADPYRTRLRHAFARKVTAFNAELDADKRHSLMRDFLVFEGDPSGTYVGPDFYCEYGFNVIIGEDVNMGPGILIADVGPVRIGSRTLIGPRCQFYTPCHPLTAEERQGTKGPDWAEPITIGTDCWIGGGVVICPGVTIGNGCTIGAGSVVTKSIEERSVAVGNPARVVRRV